MKVKKIVFIRHGDYTNDTGYHLSDRGKGQIEKLALKLLSEFSPTNVKFISSMANRAVESSEVLKRIWEDNGVELSFEKFYEIWSGNDAYDEQLRFLEEEQKEIEVYSFSWLDKFIKDADCEVIVIVSHMEFVEEFPMTLGFSDKTIDKGYARVLDLDLKTDKEIRFW